MTSRNLCIILSLGLGVASAPAQSTFGEIRGTVTDATGAVVAGAAVSAKNTGTGETRKVTTSDAGNYEILNLDAGTYEVTIENSGFRTTVIRNLILRAREIVRADGRLEVTGVSTEVIVTDSRQVIQTEAATIVDSKSSREILAFAGSFRAGSTNSIFAIISSVPGAQSNPSGSEVSLAGGAPFQSTSSVDGISTINVRSNGIITEMFPSADAIDELKVSSVLNNAEFAQMGDVTVTSRAGTNDYHGSAFWYHQNGAMDARDTFSTRQSAPFKVSNDFGYRVGGPVIRNKTFLFGAQEHLRFRAQSVINVIVPPDSYRAGNLSSAPQAAINDPIGGGVFPGKIIPANRIAGVSSKALDLLWERQNVPGDNVSTSNYRVQRPQTA
ncbi:MAG: carboxypeptidase-like regulatory domain-containing protein, partial [Bryobacteraceae bacterium]